MSAFGKSTVGTLSHTETAIVGRFIRTEPLWPLLKGIWRLRRMPADEYERAMNHLTRASEFEP